MTTTPGTTSTHPGVQVEPRPGQAQVACIPVLLPAMEGALADSLVEETRALLAEGTRTVVIDLARVSRIELSGLIRLSRLETLGAPGAVVLAGLQPGPLRMVRAAALHARLPVFATRRAALDAQR